MNTPLDERVASSIVRLSSAAHDLNEVSGELGKAIAAIDAVLQTLNIGVPTWATIESGNDMPDSELYWSRDIGYAKVSNRWGISLRTVNGHYNFPDEESCESWLFGDAPRWLRIVGVAKIPDLLEALIKSTEETTKKLKTKTTEANQLATAIAQAAGKKPPTDVVPSPFAAMAAEVAKNAALVATPTETAAEMAKNNAALVAEVASLGVEVARAEVARATALGAEAAKRLTPTWVETAKKSARRGK